MISASRLVSLLVPNKTPWVAVACICEKVLREEDGVLSAIRIVDKFQVQAQGIPSGAVPAIPLTALISLKSGDVEGQSEISLRLITPSGAIREVPQRYPILLLGKEHGANLIVNMLLPAKEFGHYELKVIWNDTELTSIPFRLVGPDESMDAETPSLRS